MNFNNYFGLLFLLWLPFLTALYFFHAKPKKLRISSHFLWQAVLDKQKKNSILETFQNSLLYWLQIAFFLFLFTALSDPFSESPHLAKKALIIIENSGSMSAVDYRYSRLEEAKSLAHQWIQKQTITTAEIIAWSEIPLTMPPTNIPAIAINAVPQTHLKRGNFNLIFELLLKAKSENTPVFIAAGNLSENEREALNYLELDFFLLAEKDDNAFFCGVTNSKNDEQQKRIKVNICQSGQPGAINLQVLSDNKLQQNITLPDTKEEQQSVNIELSSINPSAQIKLLLTAKKDLIKEDNIYFLGSDNTKEKIGHKDLQNNPLHNSLGLFFSTVAPVIDHTDNTFAQSTMFIEYLNHNANESKNQNSAQKPFTISLLKNCFPTQSFHRSFLIDPSSPIVKYLQGNNFRPNCWSWQDSNFYPLVMAVDQNLTNFVPIIGQHKLEPSHFIFNLDTHTSLANNIELPIILENIRRFWQKQYQETLLAEMGEAIKDAAPLELVVDDYSALDYYTNNFVLSGLYTTQSNKKIFCPFPVSESRLKAIPELTNHQQKLNISANKEYLDIEKNNYACYFGLFAILITIVEWFIFCRQL